MSVEVEALAEKLNMGSDRVDLLCEVAKARIDFLEDGLRRALNVIDGPYRDIAGMRPNAHPAVDYLRNLIGAVNK